MRIDGVNVFVKFFLDLLLRFSDEILFGCEHFQDREVSTYLALETLDIPDRRVAFEICRDDPTQSGLGVPVDLFTEVAAVDDPVTHLVDDVALRVRNIVVVDELFADFEVDAFDFLLGVLDRLHKHRVFDRGRPPPT